MWGLPVVAQTTILLIGSNMFMTFARYAHLRSLLSAVYFIFRGQA